MTLHRTIFVLGALACAVSVLAGAFGAHGLRDRLDPQALDQWQTAARYFMFAGMGSMIAALAAAQLGARSVLAGWLLLAGGTVFAGAVGGLALGAPRWFGAVAPLGGLGLIAGFAMLAFAAFRSG